MGCDIHAHSEVKIKGIWHHYSSLDIDRSYELFTKMAGVRAGFDEEIEPISLPRGLPDDVTFLTKYLHDNDDGHSTSFLNLKECLELFRWYEIKIRAWNPTYNVEDEFGYIDGNGWESIPNSMFEDARLVFWFDN